MFGIIDDVKHFLAVVIAEGKSVSTVFILIVCLYRIPQTAGLADDRNGSIAERDQLCQSARLKTRRHEERVCRRIQLMRKVIGITDIRGNAVSIFPCVGTKHVFILRISGSDHYELCKFVRNPIHDITDQI